MPGRLRLFIFVLYFAGNNNYSSINDEKFFEGVGLHR
jgi:hypothetical protein